MKVHGHPLSSCTRKILVTLAEKAATAELVVVDLLMGEHRAAPHVALHPFAMIPVLEDDGFVLYESRAILRYLDRRLPGPSLVPSDSRAVARMDQWLSVDQSYVAPHMSALVGERVVKTHLRAAPDAAKVAAAEDGLRRALAVIDRALAESRFLAGEALTLADISLMPYVAALPIVGASALVGGAPNVARWWEGVSARPSWTAATSAVG